MFDKQCFQKSQSVLVVRLGYASYSVVIETRFSIGDVLQCGKDRSLRSVNWSYRVTRNRGVHIQKNFDSDLCVILMSGNYVTTIW